MDGQSAFNSIHYFNSVFVFFGKQNFGLYVEDFFQDEVINHLFETPQSFQYEHEIDGLVNECEWSMRILQKIVSTAINPQDCKTYIETINSFCINAENLVSRTLKTCSDCQDLDLVSKANAASQKVLTDCQHLITLVDYSGQLFGYDIDVSDGGFPFFDDSSNTSANDGTGNSVDDSGWDTGTGDSVDHTSANTDTENSVDHTVTGNSVDHTSANTGTGVCDVEYIDSSELMTQCANKSL